MYLKRLDISGFKSFPDPTTVIFNRGITVIVGPNGCGKTNILDALRWVLGEQRPRLLRGGRMEEVIFTGTRQRPPLNMAEVTLIVDNHAGRLALPYTEVSVTRRLFRSGESEYLLNNAACRLKDITGLFADTGMGSHSYSVIGQGMIDSLLSDNPEDRRFLFEEAAGISRYKARKKEALHKLEATEHDLLRVHDVRREVEQRVAALRVQVHRAKRYKRVSDQLAGIEWEQLVSEYRRHERELAAVLEEYNRAANVVASRDAELARTEADLELARLELAAAETQAAELSESLSRAVTAAHEAETELVRDRERRENLQATIDRLTKEIAERTARNGEWIAQSAAMRAQAEDLAVRRQEHEAGLQESERCFSEENDRLGETRAAREALVERLRDGEQAYGRHQADLAYRTELADARANEKGELSNTLTRLELEQGEVSTTLARVQQRRDDLARELDIVNGNLAEAEREIVAAQETEAALAQELGQCEKEVAALQAQVDTLAGVVSRGEGLGQGAEAVLRQRERLTGAVEGWAQRISTPADKKAALEAALAGWLGALWCETPEVAEQVLHLLQQDQRGQAALWDPSLPRAGSGERAIVTDEGFRGWLVDDCHVEPDMRPMAEALLGSVILADSSQSARRVFCGLEGKYPVVSLDGTAFIPPGLVCAGTGGTSVLGRGHLLVQLRDNLLAKTQRQSELGEAHRAAVARSSDLRRSAGEYAQQRERLSADLGGVEVDLGRAQATAAELERRRVELHRHVEKVDTELVLARKKEQAAVESRRDWEEDRQRLAEQLARAEEHLAEQEVRYRAALNRLNEQRMAGVGLSGRVERLNEDRARTAELLEHNARALADRSRESEDSRAELARLIERIAAHEALWARLLTEKDCLSEQRNAALGVLDGKRELFAAREKDVKARRKERDDADAERHRWEMKRAEVSATVDQAARRAADRFGKSREELRTAAEQLQPERTISDDDIFALKTKLERIGPVNLLALEEYERERERLDFLDAQIGDLDRAKAALRQTISELNHTAGERFMETFGAARLHFQNVFTELFQGGEADVRLAEPENPLESPIEIFARPRGKKPLGILHLSGGERALTAIAMLFGLYLVKPSPFCILDEVDAPLDDANTVRFLRLLERFKGHTQFAVITHNKLTMERGDHLYGVTMEQPGVSRLVSVRLNPNEPEGEDLFLPVRLAQNEVSAGVDEQSAN